MRGNFNFDQVLASAVAFLLVFGLVMIASIGVPKSIALSAPGVLYPSCSDAEVDCYLLLKKHLLRLFVALGAAFLAYKIPLLFWQKMAPLIFFMAFSLLLLVVFLGNSFGTIATNWITILNTSFQPSEFAKLALIIYLAYWFSRKKELVADFQQGFLPFCAVAIALILPVVLQNDFGHTLILSIVAACVYLVAGARLRHLALGVLVALLVMIVAVASVDHVRERFQGFMSVDKECLEDYCWQSQQANIAVATGGFWGKGLTQGVQKSYWLPQASDDFIFAASAEELGFWRISLVVLVYLIIAVRGFAIAQRAENDFDKLLATGLTTWIAFQAFLNIMVNTALFPVTGITLPFVSYGGSSLLMSLFAIGILLNISANTGLYENNTYWRRNRRTYSAKPGRYRRT